MSVILVTGSSTGIGQEAALHMARRGNKVYASVRNPDTAVELRDKIKAEDLDVEIVRLDLLDHASITACVDEVVKDAGRLDAVISNAGIGGGRAVEETPMAEVREIYETNFFGSVAVMQAVAPHMRRQCGGRIVNVTSLAARNIMGCHAFYSSSKAAMEAVASAMAQELARFNISVSCIEPGVVLTPIWGKGSFPDTPTPYADSIARLVRFCEFGLGRPALPSDCALAIQDAIESDQPLFRYPVGPDAEDFVKAYGQVDDEEWMRIACLDNEAYAERISELGIDYYRS